MASPVLVTAGYLAKPIVSNSPTDDDLIAQYRERFRRGPIGVWTTSLGAGWDICYGCQFEFNADLSGRAYMYDSGEDEEPETETPFTWKSIEDFTIETQPVGEMVCEDDWGVIRYDFDFALSKYGGDRILVLYEINHYVKDNPGFWWSPNPVVLADENPREIYLINKTTGS